MEIEEYITQIKNLSNSIKESLKNSKPDSLSYKYIISIEQKFKDILDSIKDLKINKYEIEFLKLQEERDVLLKSVSDKATLNLKLIEINQKIIDVGILIK
jgi:hypothetical protein